MTKAQLIRRRYNKVLLPMLPAFFPLWVLMTDMMFQYMDDRYAYGLLGVTAFLLVLGGVFSYLIARTVCCPDCHRNLYFSVRRLPSFDWTERADESMAEILGDLTIRFCPYCGTDLHVEEGNARRCQPSARTNL
ncbi:MAG: hypothetical protein IT577_00385 [Verrucomicrobiae bacterium]|nr:hypothetical protein [Verrucomicrobiae bacterium]